MDLIPAASGPVEKIDDATLRSLLFELKEYTSKKEAEELLKSREDGSFEASQLIRYLADIVLFRDFSKIVTLFKDNSLKKVVEKSIKTDVDTNRIKKLAVHLLRYSEETVHELRKRVWSKSLNELGHPVVIFWATSGAKVYNAKLKGSNGKYEMNRTFEEETWIVSAEGDNSRVAAVSPALQSMAGRERDDRLSFVFAVGRDMKSQNSKERSIAENEAKDIIRKKYEETTKGK
ncbi:MAG: hypothetical protein BM562_14795 [Alphaproteobacteria bacterium MedPE-SWcel]|nr:MAG: hypothetical protein BM562_14795 [Alphaproteobacteria bacterium MedPE-SWcel]